MNCRYHALITSLGGLLNSYVKRRMKREEIPSGPQAFPALVLCSWLKTSQGKTGEIELDGRKDGSEHLSIGLRSAATE